MAAKTPTAPLAAPAAPAVPGVATADAAADALISTGQEINSDNNGQLMPPEAGIDGSAPSADDVAPALAAAAELAAANAAPAGKRSTVRNTVTEEYEEITADTDENVALKDAAVRDGRRVLKVGTGTGAVVRIYK